jgi:hypothetical protein
MPSITPRGILALVAVFARIPSDRYFANRSLPGGTLDNPEPRPAEPCLPQLVTHPAASTGLRQVGRPSARFRAFQLSTSGCGAAAWPAQRPPRSLPGFDSRPRRKRWKKPGSPASVFHAGATTGNQAGRPRPAPGGCGSLEAFGGSGELA